VSGWQEIVLRFLLGGAIVSIFAVAGELFRPKTFAGIFGAAPSVALATLLLTFHAQGGEVVHAEANSMLFGALAFVGYGTASAWIVRRGRVLPVWLGAGLSWIVWLAIAFGLWSIASAGVG
jgi:hypothetical protein